MIYSINEINTDQYYQAKKERLEGQKKQDEERGSGYVSQYGVARYSNVASNTNKPSSHVENNPKHKNAKSIEDKRKRYDDLMPKSKTPSERKLDADRDKERKENQYAKSVTDRKFRTVKGRFADAIVFNNDKYDLKDIQDAERSARRHYRRTHKNEAAGIFSSINFI